MLRSFLLFAGLFASVWLLLFVSYEKLRFVRPGSDLVSLEKTDTLAKQKLFTGHEKYRVIALGNSKTLASFKPDVFDRAFGGSVRSYNFGLPGEPRFLPVLETILQSGNRPTHLLLQLPWASDADDRQPPLLKDDNRILQTLIPFRSFFRNLALFTFQSRHAGFVAEWRHVKSEVESVDLNRGWYFISGQSHDPGNRLPPDFALPSDTPHQPLARSVDTSGAEYAELQKLARRYHFQVLIVPWSARVGEFAPAADDGTRVVSQQPYIAALGPNYWLFAPTLFSDPVHMNPGGAELYSTRLAAFLRGTGALDGPQPFLDDGESK